MTEDEKIELKLFIVIILLCILIGNNKIGECDEKFKYMVRWYK